MSTWTNPIEERRNRESAQSLQDRENLVYVATINVLGYLPMMDIFSPFESAQAAWEFLLKDRKRAEDDTDPDQYAPNDPDRYEYSDTVRDLSSAVEALRLQSDRYIMDAGLNQDGTGTIHGNTPGYDGLHDLGLNYSVSLVPQD